MAQVSARERLTRLIDLASESGGPARRELTGQLADLLLDWPASYPPAMREPFEALLEKALQEVDSTARTLLAERFVKRSGMPLTLLNLLVLDAAPEIRSEILQRNASAVSHTGARPCVDEPVLMFAARTSMREELADILALQFRIGPETAVSILADHSAHALAILCKGAQVRRAAFSALAVLARPDAAADEHYRRLATYDSIPQDGARALLLFWRKQLEPVLPAVEAA